MRYQLRVARKSRLGDPTSYTDGSTLAMMNQLLTAAKTPLSEDKAADKCAMVKNTLNAIYGAANVNETYSGEEYILCWDNERGAFFWCISSVTLEVHDGLPNDPMVVHAEAAVVIPPGTPQ